MVALNQPFNAHSVQPASRLEPLPEGWYPVIITATELKPTQDNSGGYFEFKFSVIEGPHVNRQLLTRLNVYNANETAVRIATEQMSAICWSVGVMQLSDTAQLHNLPLQVYVVQRPNERDGGKTNDIRAFRDRTGNEPWKAGQQQHPSQPPSGWSNAASAPSTLPYPPPQPGMPTQPPAQPVQQPQNNGPLPWTGSDPAPAQTPSPAPAPWQQPSLPPQAQPPQAQPSGWPQQQPQQQQQQTPPNPPWQR